MSRQPPPPGWRPPGPPPGAVPERPPGSFPPGQPAPPGQPQPRPAYPSPQPPGSFPNGPVAPPTGARPAGPPGLPFQTHPGAHGAPGAPAGFAAGGPQTRPGGGFPPPAGAPAPGAPGLAPPGHGPVPPPGAARPLGGMAPGMPGGPPGPAPGAPPGSMYYAPSAPGNVAAGPGAPATGVAQIGGAPGAPMRPPGPPPGQRPSPPPPGMPPHGSAAPGFAGPPPGITGQGPMGGPPPPAGFAGQPYGPPGGALARPGIGGPLVGPGGAPPPQQQQLQQQPSTAPAGFGAQPPSAAAGPFAGAAPPFGGPPTAYAPPGAPLTAAAPPPPFGAPPPTAQLQQSMGALSLGQQQQQQQQQHQQAPPFQQQMSAGGPPPPQAGWQQQPPQPSAGQRRYPMPGGGLVPQPPPLGGQPPPPQQQQQQLQQQQLQQGRPGVGRAPAPFATGTGATGTASRIDPNQIPRPQPAIASSLTFETRVNGTANLPPPATSQFSVRDTGNCSPKIMRCTLNTLPCSSDLLKTSGMPFALVVQPMAAPDPDDTPIPVVDFGETGPVRCSRCAAYVNPLMRFVDQGRRFICNLCGCTNETPREYVCNLGPDGRRRDADERPELMYGSVDFVAPKKYTVREPMPPVYFFLVDASLNAVTSGATACACHTIKQVLSDLPAGPRTKVGIATFNSAIQFYSLNPSLAQPSILIVPEVNDVYTPLPSDLVVPLEQAKERVESLLDMIPGLYADTRVPDSCFGAAVQGAYLATKETGGKIIVFQSVLPSVGVGALSAREAEGRSNPTVSEKDVSKLLQPLDKTFRTMAMEFGDFQVSVDVFVTCQGFVDVASIAAIPRVTGGQVYHYSNFSAQHDAPKIYNDLRWNVVREQAMEAIMKVRCSAGLSVSDYHGNFHRRIPAEIYFPAVDCEKAVTVTITHDDKLADNSEACFQCAILYTTTAGQRRVRVHTLALPTTISLANVFRGADLDTQFAYFLKRASGDVVSHSVQSVRESLITSCVNILTAYRKFCATASSSGQLILPEALKLLPLYTLALNKSVGLRTDAKLDERSQWLARVRSLRVPLAIPLVYPRMIALHTLDLAAPKHEENGSLDGSPPVQPLPPSLPLSSEKLTEAGGVFLLENGEDAFIWVGKSPAPEVLHEIFGVRGVDEIVPGPFVLQQFDNPRSMRVNEIVNTIRQQRSSYLRLRLVKRGDPSESLFLSQMVEDRAPAGMSYVEFLVYVHRQIQNKMT